MKAPPQTPGPTVPGAAASGQVALPRPGTPGAGSGGLGMGAAPRPLSPRVYGTSQTDRKMREQEDFQAVVHKTRLDYLDVIGPKPAPQAVLDAAGAARYAKFEKYVQSTPLPNAGFFLQDLPKPLLAPPPTFAVNAQGNAPAGVAAAIDAAVLLLTAPALSAADAQAVQAMAGSVSHSVTDVVPFANPSDLIITYAMIEQDPVEMS